MHHLFSIARRGVVTTALALASMLPTAASSTQTITPVQDDENTLGNGIDRTAGAQGIAGAASIDSPGSLLAVSAFAPVFATSQDARAYWNMAVRAYASPMPDARATAKAFIQERLGIDGDAYVIAHFATPQLRSEGSADSTIKLTDALMKAFPDHSRHTFFAQVSDAVGGVTSGGAESPNPLAFTESILACRTAGECFSRIGRFLWSRTGPGYIYNTFIGTGNVIDTVREDLRPLDEAFGIFPIASTFLPEHASSLLLSDVLDTFREQGVFAELPFIQRLNLSLDTYWTTCRSDWPTLARYRFVHHARWARGRGILTQEQYELVMRGGAPNVSLDGPITLQQLRSSPPAGGVSARRFDINGYAASNIVRFVAADGSEVMYVAYAASPFVVFRNEDELRQWVVRQARDPGSLDELLSDFSIYDKQDGVFRTGVTRGLANLAESRWTADGTTIDRSGALIDGDVFDDMRAQVEARFRDDTRMQTRTSWDAWRTTINRTATLVGPLGYLPPLAIPVQAGTALAGLGTGIDLGINGRTAEERRAALEGAVMTVVTNATVALTIGRPRLVVEGAEQPESPESTSSASTSLTSLSPESVRSGEARVGYVLDSVAQVEGQDPPRRLFDPLGNDPRPPFNLREQGLGYIVQTLPRSTLERSRAIIELKKAEIDEARHRLDDFRTDSLMTNQVWNSISLDHSLVYRVDSRTPQQLLAAGGFGPSREFNDIRPMLVQRSAMGSGSLAASNIVFHEWQTGYPMAPTFHQYAVWTDGRAVASASDNRVPGTYDAILDEVHFPADVQATDIYVIDSFNPAYAEAIAKIYESRYVSTPYGVPLEVFNEYLGGRLDIDAPNRFSPQRLNDDFGAPAPSSAVPTRRAASLPTASVQ